MAETIISESLFLAQSCPPGEDWQPYLNSTTRPDGTQLVYALSPWPFGVTAEYSSRRFSPPICALPGQTLVVRKFHEGDAVRLQLVRVIPD